MISNEAERPDRGQRSERKPSPSTQRLHGDGEKGDRTGEARGDVLPLMPQKNLGSLVWTPCRRALDLWG